jgi:hypothetical protein
MGKIRRSSCYKGNHVISVWWGRIRTMHELYWCLYLYPAWLDTGSSPVHTYSRWARRKDRSFTASRFFTSNVGSHNIIFIWVPWSSASFYFAVWVSMVWWMASLLWLISIMFLFASSFSGFSASVYCTGPLTRDDNEHTSLHTRLRTEIIGRNKRGWNHYR